METRIENTSNFALNSSRADFISTAIPSGNSFGEHCFCRLIFQFDLRNDKVMKKRLHRIATTLLWDLWLGRINFDFKDSNHMLNYRKWPIQRWKYWIFFQIRFQSNSNQILMISDEKLKTKVIHTQPLPKEN